MCHEERTALLEGYVKVCIMKVSVTNSMAKKIKRFCFMSSGFLAILPTVEQELQTSTTDLIFDENIEL